MGKSELGKEQAKTHTGAVAVDDDVFMAMCQRYGVTRCQNLDDMVEIAMAFTLKRYPEGNKLAIVTTSGGAVGLSLDAVADEEATLAKLSPDAVEKMVDLVPEEVDVYNPMDAGTPLAGDVARFCELCKLFADDPAVDVIAMQGRLPLPGDTETAHLYVDLREYTSKPVLPFARMAENADEEYRNFQDAAGLPFLFGIPETVKAMQALVNYGAARRRGIAELPEADVEALNISESELIGSLSEYGLTAPIKTMENDPQAAAADEAV